MAQLGNNINTDFMSFYYFCRENKVAKKVQIKIKLFKEQVKKLNLKTFLIELNYLVQT